MERKRGTSSNGELEEEGEKLILQERVRYELEKECSPREGSNFKRVSMSFQEEEGCTKLREINTSKKLPRMC